MPSTQPALNSCLNILRRTPPGDSEKNVADLASLLHPDEESAEKLFQLADPPLRVSSDQRGKPYVLCDHNRDGDSFRSPWSNEYDPPLPDGGFRPSPRLRELEKRANEVWDEYRALYYGDSGSDGLELSASVGSVYFWDKEDGDGVKSTAEFIGKALPSFAGAFLVRKDVEASNQQGKNIDSPGALKKGTWNSVHIIDVRPMADNGRAIYQLTATVSLSMVPASGIDPGRTEIAGSLVRQIEKNLPVNSDGDHIANIGGLIEELEIDMRTHMDKLYIQKTREVIELMRASGSAKEIESRAEGQQKVAMMLTQAAISQHQAGLGKVRSDGEPAV